jgi:Ca2+-binding RTX toxin-like protein
MTMGDEPDGVSSVFDGLANKGTDPDMVAQYAQDTGLFNVSGSSAGADGEQAIAFGLELAGDGTTSLYTSGAGRARIQLFEEGDFIVGRFNTSGGTVDGDDPAALAFYIEPGTGHVHLAQFVSIEHENETDGNDALVLPSGLINATYTLTDGDDDTDTATLDLGGKVRFRDDGPSVEVSANDVTVVHDETLGVDSGTGEDDVAVPLTVFDGIADTGDDPDVTANPIGFAASAGALVDVTPALGADGPATSEATVYELTVTDNTDSGLTTTEGDPIYLFNETNGTGDAVVVGRVDDANGDAAFALAIDPATGVVSMVQYLSIRHDDRGDFDESDDNDTNTNDAAPDDSPEPGQQTLATDTVKVTVTVTDGDGDTNTDVADISAQIAFQDDGPTASLVQGTSNWLTIDETAGNQGDEPDGVSSVFDGLANKGTDPDMATQYAQDTGLFNVSGSSAGADGEKATAFGLELAGDGTTSLFTSGAGRAQIQLFAEEHGGEQFIVGRYDTSADVGNDVGPNDPAAFAFYIEADTGHVHLAQFVSIEHGNANDSNDVLLLPTGLINASYTLTDGDDDTDTATLDLGGKVRFLDDGPTITAADDTTVSEDGLASGSPSETGSLNISYGADGKAVSDALVFADADVDFSGSSTMGSNLTSNGVTVDTVLVDGVLVGYTVDEAAPSSPFDTGTPPANTVFFITLDDSSANGSYSFTMVQPLDHPAPVPTAPEPDRHFIDLTFNVVGKDGDGDTVPQSATVRVDAAGSVSSIDYSGLTSGVFVNLSETSQTVDGQTVSMNKATDRDGVTKKVVGIDDVTGIEDATGSQDDDILVGSDGPNVINGDAGDDIVIGGAGDDTLDGGAGSGDWLDYSDRTADLTVDLSNSSAQEVATGEFDTISNFENLRGGSGDDTLTGADGVENIIDGGAGADIMSGGSAADTYIVDNVGDEVIENTGSSIDEVQSSISYSLGLRAVDIITPPYSFTALNILPVGTVEKLTLTGTADIDGYGADGLNTFLFGNSGDNLLYAGNGNDEVTGGAGADTQFGGAGNDSFLIAAGTTDDEIGDIFIGGAGTDEIVNNSGSELDLGSDFDSRANENGVGGPVSGGGIEQIVLNHQDISGTAFADTWDFTNIQFSQLHSTTRVSGGSGGDNITASNVAGNKEPEYHGDSGADTLTGQDLADKLFGGSGADTISGGGNGDLLVGGAGGDQMEGGAGNDTFRIDALDDEVGDSFSGGADYDTIINNSGDALDLTGFGVVGTPTGIEEIQLNSGANEDAIRGVSDGTTEDNVFNFTGVEFRNLSTTSRISGGGGNDTITASDRSGNNEPEYHGDAGEDTLIGQGLADKLYGGADNDRLSGGGDDDLLVGGAGNDVQVGGAGSDTFRVTREQTETDRDSFTGEIATDMEGDTLWGGTADVTDVAGTALTDGQTDILDNAGGGAFSLAGFSIASTDIEQINFNGGTLVGTDNTSGPETFDMRGLTLNNVSAAIDVHGAGGADIIHAADRNNMAYDGGSGNDQLFGSNEAETLRGGADDDLIEGAGGGDTLAGDGGTDTVTYENDAGAVAVSLGSTSDKVFVAGDTGGYTDVVVTPGSNPDGSVYDRLTNNNGEQKAFDGSGSTDSLSGFENIIGSGNNDALIGSDVANEIDGGDGNDIILGLDGNDTLNGDGGNDTVIGGLGDDVMNGGAGSGDWLDYSDRTASVEVNLSVAGPQEVVTGEFDTISGFENLRGGSGDDTLTGADGVENIIDGGAGADVMSGGSAADIYIVDNAGDVVIENFGSSIDEVRSSISYTLGIQSVVAPSAVPTPPEPPFTFTALNDPTKNDGSIEKLTLTGTADINGYGVDGLNTILTGNSGNNLLYAGDGNDVLTGGGGADTQFGGDGDDMFKVETSGDETGDVYVGGTGTDTLDNETGAALELAKFDSTATDGTSGDGINNIDMGDQDINGTSGDNTLNFEKIDFFGDVPGQVVDGGGGVDVITASDIDNGAQPDYRGGDGDDTLIGKSKNDKLFGDDGVDNLSGGDGDDLLVGGDDGDILDGGDGDNTFRIDAVDDEVGDTYTGGVDDDTIVNNSGDALDLTVFGKSGSGVSGDGIDEIQLNSGNNEDAIRGDGAGNEFDFTDVQFRNLSASSRISGAGGNDKITASNVSGNNEPEYHGDAGEDELIGQDLADKLYGGADNDRIYGGGAADTLVGGAGDDVQVGGTGNDTFLVTRENEETRDGIANVATDMEGDTLWGGEITASGIATGGNFTKNGDASTNDTIDNVGGGAFSLAGFKTTDTGIERIQFNSGTLVGTDSADVFDFTGATLDNVGASTDVHGAGGDDVITAINRSNMVYDGGSGDDTLNGSAGAETLRGGEDDDLIEGAGGGDTLAGDAGIDTVSYENDGGAVAVSLGSTSDRVFVQGGTGGYTSVVVQASGPVAGHSKLTDANQQKAKDGSNSTDILSGFENIIGSGHNDALIGSDSANEIDGGGGNDIILGLGGNDTLTGGAGKDTLTGGGDADTFVFVIGDGAAASGDADRITDFEVGTDSILIKGTSEALVFEDVGLDLAIRYGNAGEYIAVLEGLAGTDVSDDITFTSDPTDPIALDLNGDGVDLSATTAFDIDADGDLDQIGWTGPEDGLLVMDLDGSGAIENGTELFSEVFNGGSFANSLEALASLDDNGDGVIDASDAAFGDIKVWQDANSDGVTQEGELQSLVERGIEAINLEAAAVDRAENGNTIFAEGTYTKADGSTGTYVGVNLGAANDDEADTEDAVRQSVGLAAGAALVVYAASTAEVAAGLADVRVSGVPLQGDVTVSEDFTVTYTSMAGFKGADTVGLELVFADGSVVNRTVELEVLAEEAPAGGSAPVDAADAPDTGGDEPVVTSGSTLGDGPAMTAKVTSSLITGDDGDNVLVGTDGDDILAGGLGADLLTGGGGADTFVLSSLAEADIITDYSFAEGDKIDLGALLDTAFSGGSLPAHLVKATEGPGGDVLLEVDIDGLGTAHGFEAVATLQDHTSMGDTIRVVIDNAGTETDVAVV